MANDTEPRALGAALSAPAFVTRGHGVAMHAANRHVERWAPEANADRVRPMRSLGFVDRLVAPWVETAQRSASLRLFSQYASAGASEREPRAVSWVFPRPWYQDELDWMAAARRVAQATRSDASSAAAPTLLTTRATFVAASQPIAAPPVAMPSALYEHVAPSLSIAAPRPATIPGVGFGGEALPRGEAYSPLVSLAAVQAAELMSRTVGSFAQRPAAGSAAGPAMTPALRSVLSSILERAAMSQALAMRGIGTGEPSRLAMSAPELVTPPAPRPAEAPERGELPSRSVGESAGSAAAVATQVAERYAEQRARIVELQRIAQLSAQRELAARAELIARASAGAPASAGGTQAGAAAAATAASAAPASGTAEARAAQVARSAELRAAAERAEAELRQRAAGQAQTAAQAQAHAAAIEAQRQVDAATEEATERARVEARIAQRLAERTTGQPRTEAVAQRLHEQARAEAAAHARTPIAPAPRVDVAAVAAALPVGPAPEVSAAIAGLSPELAGMLGPTAAQRPERTLQAIRELNETLRTVELLARSSAAGAAFEVTRGPRLMMPAGLGGLIHAMDRAQALSERPAVLGGPRRLAPLPSLVEGSAGGAGVDRPRTEGMGRIAREVRVPMLSWLAPHAAAIAPSTALSATAASAPAALSHVAWADRWLARFAGATPQSLDMISAVAAAAPAARMQALASAAPDAVFVAPDFFRGDLGAERGARFDADSQPIAMPSGSSSAAVSGASPAARVPGVPGMRQIQPLGPSEPLRRFDDAAETPDDVFAAISAAASRSRSAPSRPAPSAAVASGALAPVASLAATAARPTLADLVAHAAPTAPGAGLSAQLASSPFAPALRHVLPLPSAASFDVRSLFGAGLGTIYLAGLLGSASNELEIGAQKLPTWASWAEAPFGYPLAADHIDRVVPEFEAAYVGRDAIGARDAAERGELAETTDRSGAAAAASAAMTAELAAAMGANAAMAAAMGASPVTTLRTALLSWDVTTAGALGAQPGAPQLVPALFTSGSAIAPSASAARELIAPSLGAARTMIDAMSLPLLGEAATERAERPGGWAAPGMIANRAHMWSVAQERSSSDLALDFVTPELVLAARVYGLGPAEAAQASRLAVAGPGQLAAMASTVDRTFVEAMAIGHGARMAEAERRQRIADAIAAQVAAADGAQAAPAARGAADTGAGAAARVAREAAVREAAATAAAAARDAAGEVAPAPSSDARVAITTAFPTAGGDIAAAIAPTMRGAFLPPSTGAAFGVGRPTPRGAFLWPSATVAALGMTAAGSDGQLSMPVAALELLAAQVVAELGTYTALSEAETAARGFAGESDLGSIGDVAGAGSAGGSPSERIAARAGGTAAAGALATGAPTAGSFAGSLPVVSPAAGALAAGLPPTLAARRDAIASGAEPGEADVLAAAATFVPVSRRARFDALYVALSQSAQGRSWSPAARAARALALAGRGEDVAVTARERAATAWDVLPVVYPSVVADPAAGPDGAAGDSSSAASQLAAAMSSAAAATSTYVAPGYPGSAGGSAAARTAGPRAQRGRDAAGSPSAFDGPEWVNVTASPGLAGLSARAGEALGSYVAAASPPMAPTRDRSESSSVAQRAPSAASDYVQTGRTGGRHGGGEIEIPPWFESAARKMLAERSGDPGISFAELTLVTAAPPQQIAAAEIAPGKAAPPSPGGTPGAAQAGNAPQIDIEKLASDVYRDILIQMDIARARNGDPYQ